MKIRVKLDKHLYKKTAHGPQSWPWWRLFSITLYRADVHKPSTGYHFWLYSRWGARLLGVYFDRRVLPA